ncbi:hypothetical protein CKY06_06365 [Photorhabdus sp. S15-56]|nr:hypothetical protein PluTT01m_08480 [Photorhabdus laumondii subsp. laumondii]RAW74041.1 hypothetical protein CKY15_04155 [Photorhabdus sp. S7-51]RAW75643.1 hypothetical protein CKY14_02835 [Photorhabdus sp. S14-60]RAW78805.1 hypothetical protein CKY06_06365 [Photorhabdus sp. S15-56]
MKNCLTNGIDLIYLLRFHYTECYFGTAFVDIPVIFQVASLLAALTHPSHIVRYAPGDSLPCRRDPS